MLAMNDITEESRPKKRLKEEQPTAEARVFKMQGNVNGIASGSEDKKTIFEAASQPVASEILSDYEKCSIFPQKLMKLLKNNESPNAIWWLEDGASFALEPEQFTKVMNKVSRTSKKQVKLDSILRNLYRWGFKKLKGRDLPPNVLAYSHPNFERDACVELQTFSKKSARSSFSAKSSHSTASTTSFGFDASRALSNPALNHANSAAPSALAKALSARAQEGYTENWNDEGAAGKMSMALQQQPQQKRWMIQQQAYGGRGAAIAVGGTGGEQPEEEKRMYQSMMVQEQHQRQMILQQELFYHESQRQQQQQAVFLGAAAADQFTTQKENASEGLPYPSTSPYPPY